MSIIGVDFELQVYGPEATMTGICKRAIDCIMSEAQMMFTFDSFIQQFQAQYEFVNSS